MNYKIRGALPRIICSQCFRQLEKVELKCQSERVTKNVTANVGTRIGFHICLF